MVPCSAGAAAALRDPVKIIHECGPCGCKREIDGADEAMVRRAERRWSLAHGRCVRAAQRDLARQRTGTGFAATSAADGTPPPYVWGDGIGPRRVESIDR